MSRTRLKNDGIRELFYKQIKTLEKRGCPRQIIEMFQKQEKSINQKPEILFDEGNIPLVLVIPLTFLDLYRDAAMIRRNDKVGKNNLMPKAIIDNGFQMSKNVYCIYDVENGELTRNRTPKQAIKIIKRQRRLPLNFAEVIALTIQSDVLSRFSVMALCSQYDRNGQMGKCVPGVSRGGADGPFLDYSSFSESVSYVGFPSCGSRF